MIMEKKRSKGSFLSFFHWNHKSQKKIFCNNPKLPDVSNQEKENMIIMPMSQIKIDENGETLSNIASSDFNFALSNSSDDEECKTNKSLGLVARLMGLDSLPPIPTVQFHEINLQSMPDYYNVDSTNTALKSNKFFSGAFESSTMNKFRNEALHPTSATNNKLLSTDKSHGYMKSKNASYVMRKDDKIIEVSPQPYMRNRMSSVGFLSVPLRSVDLQEKLKVAPHETNFNVNGKPKVRRSNLENSSPTFKGSRDSENNSSRLGKGKSGSLVTPSKTNVRDTLTLNGNRRNMKQKSCNGQDSNVLRQNSVANKGILTSKVDTDKPTHTSSAESSKGAKKATNKGAVNSNIESKRSSIRVTDKQKEFSVSKRMSSSQKKSSDQNDARCSDSAVNNYESKSIKCNVTIDESIYQDAFSMKENDDVISFTFTSPLRKKLSESRSTTKQAMKTRTRIDVDSFDHNDKVYPEKLSLSPTRLNVIDVDALSAMLSHINPPQCTLEIEGSDSMVCKSSREHGNSFHMNLLSENLDSMDDNCRSSSDNMMLNMNQHLQILQRTEDPRCSRNSESGNDSCYQHTRTSTTFENHFISKTYLDCEDSTHDEAVPSSQIHKCISPNYKKNWSEKSSTTSSRMIELEYVKHILSNAESMAEELVAGETDNIMPMQAMLFDLLENQRNGVESYEKYSKLERKAIFDCVSECLELKCRQVFVARCKAWPRWVKSVTEEVYKDIFDFRSMEEELVVDEIVSKDMSTPLGKWLNFDIEASENGLELELDIVTYLIDELVSDIWLV